jgi:hypothetical protein
MKKQIEAQVEAYEKAYESKYNYILSRFNMRMVVDESDNNFYDAVQIMYDFLDTVVSEKQMRSLPCSIIFDEFVDFAKEKYKDYIIDEY